MTQVILFSHDIQDHELLKSSLAVPYVTVDAGYMNVSTTDASDLIDAGPPPPLPPFADAKSALPMIKTIDLSETDTVGILYENMSGLIHNLSDLVGGLVEKSATIKIIDLLTCNLNRDDDIDKIKELEVTHGVTIRYSVDLTGHPDSMGNWLLESHGVKVKGIYFNEKIDEWKHVLHAGGFDEANFLAVVAEATMADDPNYGEAEWFVPPPTQEGEDPSWSNSDITAVRFKPGITTIGINAFFNCKKLKSVTIPDSVVTIDTSAFRDTDALETLELGSNLQSIGAHAFRLANAAAAAESSTINDVIINFNNSEEGVIGDIAFAFRKIGNLKIKNLGTGTYTIGENAFSFATIGDLTLGNGITSIVAATGTYTISRYAFSYATIGDLTLGNGLTSIGAASFMYTQITNITINSDKPYTISESAFSNATIGDITLGNGLTSLDKLSFQYAQITKITINSDKPYTIGFGVFLRATIGDLTIGNGLTSIVAATGTYTISEGAFSFATIGDITLGNGLTSLDKLSFQYAQITKITINSDKPYTIGFGVFYTATIGALTLGNGMPSIPDQTFKDAQITNITINSDKPYTIGVYAFYGNNALETLDFGSNLQSIGEGAFRLANSDAAAESPTINDVSINFNNSEAGAIGSIAFMYRKIGNLTIKNLGTGTYTIGGNAFYGATIGDITLGNGSIPDLVFIHAQITNITINSNKPYTIGEYAFGYNNALTTLDFGSNLQSIGKGAFQLANAAATAESSTINDVSINFNNSEAGAIGSIAFMYRKIGNLTIKNLGTGTYTIGESAFSYATIGDITLGNGSIPDRAFMHAQITNLTINSNKPYTIGVYAFGYNNALTTLEFGSNLQSIGKGAFQLAGAAAAAESSTINDVSINFNNSEEGVIGSIAFMYRKIGNLTIKNLGTGTYTIGENAFAYNNALTTLDFGSNLQSIGKGAFAINNNTVNKLNALTINSTGTNPLVRPALVLSGNVYARYNVAWVLKELDGNGRPIYYDNAMKRRHLYHRVMPNYISSDGQPWQGWVISDMNRGVTNTSDTYHPNDVWSAIESDAMTPPGGMWKMWIANDADTSIFTDNSDHENNSGGLETGEWQDQELTFEPTQITYRTIESGAFSFRAIPTITLIGINGIGGDAFRYIFNVSTMAPLPPFWEEATGEEGELVYVDHSSGTTQSDRPPPAQSTLTIDFNNSEEGVIGAAAFAFTYFDTVTITNSAGAYTFDAQPFGYATIGDLTLGNGLTSIPAQSFRLAQITNITINSDKPYTIGEAAFSGNNALTTLDFGSNLQSIGKNAFAIWNANAVSSTINDVIINFNNSEEGVIGAGAFLSQNITNLTITNSGDGTYTFDEQPFYNATIGDLTLGNGLTSIPAQSFRLAQITNITINSDKPYTIGEAAFSGNNALTTLDFGSNLQSIGKNAFAIWNANAVSSTINDVIINFNNSEEGVIGAGAFLSQNITNLTITNSGGGTYTIGENAFLDCRINALYLQDGLTSIGATAFQSLRIETDWFRGISILDISDQTSPYEIGERAFYDQKRIYSLRLGSGITKIGAGAFSMDAPSLGPTWRVNAVDATGQHEDSGRVKMAPSGGLLKFICAPIVSNVNITFNVPHAVIEQHAFAHRDFANRVRIENIAGTYTIGASAFYRCYISSLLLTDGLVEIGDQAFGALQGEVEKYYVRTDNGTRVYSRYRPGVRGLYIYDQSQQYTIGEYAFTENEYLKYVVFGGNLQSIGKRAFYGARLQNVVFARDTVILDSMIGGSGDEFAFYNTLLTVSGTDLTARIITIGTTHVLPSWVKATTESFTHIKLSDDAAPAADGGVSDVIDMSGFGLAGANLSGLNLSYLNLTSSWFLDVDLAGADLTNADLTDADLSGAVTGPLAPDSTSPTVLPTGYVFADGTSQKWIMGPGAVLTDADLTGADLTGADLTDAVLTDAVTGPLVPDKTPAGLPDGYKVATGTIETWLVGPDVVLTNADLSGADLSGAYLSGAVTGPLAPDSTSPKVLPTGYVFVDDGTSQKWLVGPGACVCGAVLTGSDLSGADLTGAVLTNSVTGPLEPNKTPAGLPDGYKVLTGDTGEDVASGTWCCFD